MAHRQKADGERPGLGHFRPGAHGDDFGLGGATVFHLVPRKVRRKGTRINRNAKRFPEMTNRAHMVFVTVGDEHRLETVLVLNKPCHIRKDQIDPGTCLHIRECHAKVDKDQAFCTLFTVAIDIGIHANFARSTEGQIDKFFAAQAAFSLL